MDDLKGDQTEGVGGGVDQYRTDKGVERERARDEKRQMANG